jgi:inner membrane protein
MEPITHFLTGACIGRAGFNRKSAYATLAATLAAEAADLDIFWEWKGPVEELQHHRGITHTFAGAPVVAAVTVGAVWLVHRWTRRRTAKDAAGIQPVHWGWLYAAALTAALSHLLLDWTNNYGLRPFFPFNPRWYAGSFVFIVEPVELALLALALVMPWLLGLADREIGVRKEPFRGQGWAVFALVGMVVLGCWRWAEHEQAARMIENTQLASEPVLRMIIEPYPVNLFRWHAILETRDFYQTAEFDTHTGSIESDPGQDVIYKPAATPAVEAAKRTKLGRVFLDWGAWAVVRDLGPVPVTGMDPPKLPPGRNWTTVEFTDLRFAYSLLSSRSRQQRSPLGGWVYIVDSSEDAGEKMGTRVER